MRALILLAVLALPAASYAETQYVVDRLVAPLRGDVVATSSPVAQVESDVRVEVLERYGDLARVRTPDGAEGWIESRYLSGQTPTRHRLKAVQAELDRERAQLAQLRLQADKPAGPPPEVAALEAQLAQARTELAEARAAREQAAKASAPVSAPPPVPQGPAESSGSVGLWLFLAFAMLLVGFVGGIVWVRESIRRRMGGMYLRI